MIWALLISIFLNQASSSTVTQPVSFTYSTFNSQSCINGDLICSGSVTAYDGFLSLTSEPLPSNSSSPPSRQMNRVGRVLYHLPVSAWPAMISTTFTFRISSYANSSGSADGMTFILAPDSNPSPPSSYGSYLGIFDRNAPPGANVSQLAVELDTYMSAPYDPDGNHVAIDTTSIQSPVAVQSLTSTGIDLKSGSLIKVQIDYDGWTKILYVSVAYDGYPLQRFLEKPILLSETVPSFIYVGFTASTGALSESHRLYDWSFTTLPLPSYSLKKQKWFKP